MQNEVTDATVIQFGKYKGKRMDEIPAAYLLWLFNKGCSDSGIQRYITVNLRSIEDAAHRAFYVKRVGKRK